jgi:carbonic anhydrase
MMQQIQPLPADFVRDHNAWQAQRSQEHKDTAVQLADEGQTPKAMVVGCCDSRVQPAEVFNGDIGDFFVYRNIANAVPPVDHPQAVSTAAALEYGLTVLNIPHLIVMGHSRCGGVQGCHALCSGQAPELESPDSFVGNWLQILRPAYERMQRELQPGQDPLVALEQASVLQSLDHLLTHDFIRTRVEAGTLALHGTWLDIRSGEVSAYDPQIDAFVSLAA